MVKILAMVMLSGCGLSPAADSGGCMNGFRKDAAGNCSLAEDVDPVEDEGSSPEEVNDYEGDEPGECTDGADNDRDGYWDCDDPDCAGSPDCPDASSSDKPL